MTTNRLIRLEGLAAFILSIALFIWVDGVWWVYLVFFLTPDLSMIGYLVNTRVGAISYNLVHNYAVIATLAMAGLFLDVRPMLIAAIIILGHIGLDRLLGFGLKYRTAFKDSHLQTLPLAGPVSNPQGHHS